MPDVQDAAADAHHKDAAGDGWIGFGGDAGDATPDAFVITQACPLSPPAVDSPCTQLGEECEYGSSFFRECDPVYRCDPVNQWWVPETQSTSGMCTAGSSGCPAQFSDINKYGACSNVGSLCSYPEGLCTCASYCGGPPPGGTGGSWFCFTASQACPITRPRIGSACAQEGQQCSYVVCCSGTVIGCVNGVWQDQGFNCPP